MDCILNSSNPQNFPCFENDGVLETASLFALLRDSSIGIAGRGQSDLDGESAVILLYGGEGIRVDDARIVRFDIGGDGIRFGQFLVDRYVPELPTAEVFENPKVLGKKWDVEPEDCAHLLRPVRLGLLDANFQLFRCVSLGKQSLGNLAKEERLVPEVAGYLCYPR